MKASETDRRTREKNFLGNVCAFPRDLEGNSKRNCENGKWKVGVAGKEGRIEGIRCCPTLRAERKIATHDTGTRTRVIETVRRKRGDYRDFGVVGRTGRAGRKRGHINKQRLRTPRGKEWHFGRESSHAKEKQLAESFQGAKGGVGREGGHTNKRKQQTTSANGRF